MTAALPRRPAIDVAAVEVLLCDADGNLFPSEEPAFAASTRVVNRLLAALGVDRRLTAEELQAVAVGRSFRATALELAAAHGVPLGREDLERWVREEQREVSAHLGRVLRPDPDVLGPLSRLSEAFGLAVVSSSAAARLDVCFRVTGLAELLPPERRFSAEDSLPVPTSKPHPAIYRFAGERLGIRGEQGLAIEDSVAGARSAVAAGFPTIGSVVFVPPAQREARAAALREAGVAAVMSSWWQLEALLRPRARAAPSPGRP